MIQRLLASLPLVLLATGAAAAEHPRLYFDAAGLAELRALTARIAPTVYGFVPADDWQQVLATAEKLAAAPTYSYSVQIPAPNGEHEGWDWSYTLSPEPPPRHDESPHYPPWTAMFQERADSLTTRLKHFSLAWLLTGEERFYDKAHEIVFDLIQWPYWTDPSYGKLTACLDTGHATAAVALFYDWCYHPLSPAERTQVREALINLGVLPIREQLTHLDPYHNFWAVINTGLGMAALAVEDEDPRAAAWLDEAIANTAKQFDSQGADGGSFEGPMYGTYAADTLAEFIFSLDSSGTDHALRQHPFLETLPRFGVNGLSPDVHGLPTFGDGGWGAGYADTMAMLAAHGDEAARFYLVESNLLNGLGTIDKLLFFGPLAGAETLPQPPAWRGDDAFVDIGYGFLRGGGDEPFLALKAGPPEKRIGHNHYDQNSFQITAFDKVVAADPGYRSYFDPPKRRYTVSSLGHNTILLDVDDEYLASEAVTTLGHDQVALSGGRLTELLPAPGISLLTGEAAAAYNTAEVTVLDQFRRRILYFRPNAYLVIDDLAAPEPHAFTWLLHGVEGSQAAVVGEAIELAQAQAKLDATVFAPGGVTWRTGNYPGAESYGPYAAATTVAADSLRIVAALVPRRNPVLVLNPGFEDGLAGWSIRGVDDQGPNHSATDEQAHAGTRSGRIAGAGYLYSTRFAVPAGETVTASAWYRTTGATKGASFTIYFWPATGNAFASKIAKDLVSEGEWSRVELTADVPAGTASVSVAFNYFDTGVGYVDDVAVETAAVITLSEPAVTTPVGADAAEGVTIEVDGYTHHVAFGNGGAVTSDGELAAVTVAPDGQPVAVLLLNGTQVGFAGQPLLALDQRASVTAWRTVDGWRTRAKGDLSPHAAVAAIGCRVR